MSISSEKQASPERLSKKSLASWSDAETAAIMEMDVRYYFQRMGIVMTEKGEMMIVCDNYSIEQYPLQNKIIITLPPTDYTVQDTHMMPQIRRVELTRNELTAILIAVKGMYELRGEEDERSDNAANAERV